MSSTEQGMNALEQAAANLRELYSVLTESHDRLTAAIEEIEEHDSEREQDQETLKSAFEGISGAIEQCKADLDTRGSEFGEKMDEAREALSELKGKIDTHADAIESLEEQMSTALGEANSQLADTASTFQEAQTAVGTAFGSLISTLQSARESTLEVFETVSESLDEINEKVANFSEETIGIFEEAGSQVADTLMNGASSAFGDFLGELDGNHMSKLENVYETLQGGLDDILKNLDESGSQLGSALTEMIEEVLSSLGQKIMDAAQNEIREAFEKEAREVLEALATEVASNIALMTVGMNVTGAISPILPQLAVAEKVLSLINSVLDVF